MFWLLKLLLLPIWLPFKILAELIEHSGRRSRRRPAARTSAPKPRPAVPVRPAVRQANRKRTMTAWAAIGVTGLLVAEQTQALPARNPSAE